jgi:hypothetical protein
MYLFFLSTSCYFRLYVLTISSFTYFVLTLLLASLPYPVYSVPFILISSYSVSVIYASTLKHRCISLHPRKKYCIFTFLVLSSSYFLFFHSYFFPICRSFMFPSLGLPHFLISPIDHFLSLSLSHTHTHTHTLFLFFIVTCVCVCVSLQFLAVTLTFSTINLEFS